MIVFFASFISCRYCYCAYVFVFIEIYTFLIGTASKKLYIQGVAGFAIAPGGPPYYIAANVKGKKVTGRLID